MTEYFSDIWKARYFWWHLSMSDLRNRFRNSYFGLLWALLQPLGLTVLISIVFSRLFDQNIAEYAPYVLSGVIIWECISTSLIGGSMAFLQASPYIQQTRHPLAIYPLRNVIVGLVSVMVASLALLAWDLVVLPENFGWSWLAVITAFPLLLLITWPIVTTLAYIGARFRDLPYALALILQAAWFVSPVYFKDSMFRAGGLHYLVDFNPIYHLLQIVRAPLLQGQWPTLANYTWCLGTAAVAALIAALVGARAERKVIFYL